MTVPRTIDDSRQVLRALDDEALIAAMRDGMPEAWSEFDFRFRGLLETYAAQLRVPYWDRGVLVNDVLDDEAMRLVSNTALRTARVAGYLIRALRSQFLKAKRSARRREARYDRAAHAENGERVLVSLCSVSALRASEGPGEIVEESRFVILRAIADCLTRGISAEERQLLEWVGEGIPRRDIAAWLGVSYDAVKKRVSRVCRRVQQQVPDLVARLDPDERLLFEAFLKRAGISAVALASRDEAERSEGP